MFTILIDFLPLSRSRWTKRSCVSGLAVMPNMDDEAGGGARDRVFGMAQNATADESGQVRRTITMVSPIRRICTVLY